MAEIGIIPLLNAQQLNMTQLAHNAAVRPEAAQAMAGELALALLRQESKQVQKPTESQNSDLVDDKNSGSPGSFTQGREQRRKETEEAPSPKTNPLVGNLLNLKV